MAITEQQRLYAEARFSGLSMKDSALAAGCSKKYAKQAGSRLERHPHVIAHLARLKGIESDTVPAAGRDADAERVHTAEPTFDDPRELLKHQMNDPRLDPKTRQQAAIALLPYEHKKLGESGKKEDREQAAQGIAASGRFTPAPPPRTTQLKLIS